MNPVSAEGIASRLKEGAYGDPPSKLLVEAVRSIADELAGPGAPVSKQEIRHSLFVLNKYQHFDEARQIGQAWHDTRGCDPLVQKHLVQALIELGAYDAADGLLDELERSEVGDIEFVAQAPEYQGLRGRILKQQFVRSGDHHLLRAATDAYLKQYLAKKTFYHGVNVIALRLLEERHGLPERDGDLIPQMALSVFEQAGAARRRDPRDFWPLATASEACLALDCSEPNADWCDKSELWLHRFLAHSVVTPFAIESYYRQLREVWGAQPLGAESCGDRLASIIERHVDRTQRRWSVDARLATALANHPEELEKNFSGMKSFTVSDLRTMLERSRSVGCVIDSTGVRMGTGFLMPGRIFGLPLKLVFVTNAHVISDTVPESLRLQDAKINFELESESLGAPRHHAIERLIFTSVPGAVGRVLDKPEKLDVTIVSLKTVPEGVDGLPLAANIPLPTPKTKAFVVGHPKAGPLQFSLHDSVLLDVCRYDRLMHYRTPTDPGSSGSPVFNAKWEVVALHHAGSQRAPRLNGRGEYEANEGITLQSIQHGMGVAGCSE